jgi:hypothetical protein
MSQREMICIQSTPIDTLGWINIAAGVVAEFRLCKIRLLGSYDDGINCRLSKSRISVKKKHHESSVIHIFPPRCEILNDWIDASEYQGRRIVTSWLIHVG